MAKAMIQAIMSPPPDTGEALSSQVEAALAELCQVGEEMVITSKSLGELQERSGAKIDIDRQPDRCLVRFGGFAESVQLAKTLVTEVLEGRDRTQLAEAAATMEIPPSATGRLIGPGGRQINEIQEKSGAKIDLDKVRHRKREQCATRRGTMTTVTTDNDDDGSGDNDDDSNDDDDYDDDDDKGH
ncbi:Tudor and KH domain-containing protein homolog (Partner of PIWIs protein) (BmPAPI) [Durusdinium trenchii]|uniref:Tudor and KH domain-containing protein homolog (Partner of PIWIs protein) (BmPAPI) n=1 Tax=Durusdinium trenchii TaxID=1381693 RepID=A0ABP0JZ42_9DINO